MRFALLHRSTKSDKGARTEEEEKQREQAGGGEDWGSNGRAEAEESIFIGLDTTTSLLASTSRCA